MGLNEKSNVMIFIFLYSETMKCVLIIAAVLCVMVAHVRSQGAGQY
jgi:hypothetical protein